MMMIMMMAIIHYRLLLLLLLDLLFILLLLLLLLLLEYITNYRIVRDWFIPEYNDLVYLQYVTSQTSRQSLRQL